MRDYLIVMLQEHGLGSARLLVPSDEALYVIAFLVAAWLFTHRAHRASVDSRSTARVVVAGTVGFLLGCRLYYLLLHPQQWGNPFSTWWSLEGTASWGGYLGLVGAVVILCSATRETPWRYLDLLASLAGLPIAIGRVGCFLNGDDFGRVTTVPWAIRFPAGSYPYEAHVAAGWIPAGASWSLPVHPLQLYLALNGIVLFGAATGAWHRWGYRPGMTCAVFVSAYGVTRFGLEYFRDPVAGGATEFLSSSQVMALAFAAWGAILFFGHYRQSATMPSNADG